jgi:hypothetical protein
MGMALEVETKDCNALSDVDISDMADLCAEFADNIKREQQ